MCAYASWYRSNTPELLSCILINKINNKILQLFAVLSHSTEMTNLDDTNNNSNANKHPNQTLNHRTAVGGDAKNGKVQHNNTTEQQHSTDSIHDAVDPQFRPEIRWPDLCAQIFLHAGAIYGLVFQFYTIKFYTLIWCKCELVKQFRIWWKSPEFFPANYVLICVFFFCFGHSLCTYCWQRFWHHGRCTSPILPQVVQSKCKVATAFDIFVHHFGTA